MRHIILFFLFIFSFSLYGQIGVVGGLNFSSLRSNADKSSFKIGAHIGGFYDINLTDNLYLHPQLLFSYEPTKVSYFSLSEENKSQSVDFESKGIFITTPVMLSYKFTLPKKTRLGLDLGVYASIGLGGDIKKVHQIEYDIISNTSHPLFPDERSRFDYGLVGGVRLEYEKYLISLHYKHGLYKINNELEKVSLIMVSFGYMFER